MQNENKLGQGVATGSLVGPARDEAQLLNSMCTNISPLFGLGLEIAVSSLYMINSYDMHVGNM